MAERLDPFQRAMLIGVIVFIAVFLVLCAYWYGQGRRQADEFGRCIKQGLPAEVCDRSP